MLVLDAPCCSANKHLKFVEDLPSYSKPTVDHFEILSLGPNK